jgi:hypothetical protein
MVQRMSGWVSGGLLEGGLLAWRGLGRNGMGGVSLGLGWMTGRMDGWGKKEVSTRFKTDSESNDNDEK